MPAGMVRQAFLSGIRRINEDKAAVSDSVILHHQGLDCVGLRGTGEQIDRIIGIGFHV